MFNKNNSYVFVFNTNWWKQLEIGIQKMNLLSVLIFLHYMQLFDIGCFQKRQNNFTEKYRLRT